MPPRRNKRLQRELEELQALGDFSQKINASPVDGDTLDSPPPSGTGFSALFIPEEDVLVEIKEEQKEPSALTKARKGKKRKKLSSAKPSDAPSSPIQQKSGNQGAKTDKVKERRKGKEKQEDDDDILDKALANLALRYSHSEPAASTRNHEAMASLLSVSLPHLDTELEMRQFFGSKIVSAKTNTDARLRRLLGKSNLTRPKAEWTVGLQREGLSIRALTDEEINERLRRHSWGSVAGEKWWTVEYSKRYKSAALFFMTTVMSGDITPFWILMHEFPWQADTQLQLSEYYRHREEYSTAVDHLERALYAYERAFVGAFKFTNGLNRLDFDQVENRPFFVAVHRQVMDLQRRGCFRAAFEFARLMYSLDPHTDPHGASLHLDFLAIKADLKQWLLDVWDLHNTMWDDEVCRNRLNVTCLPGWSYARALALRGMEADDHTNSEAALTEAICSFPYVVPLLAEKMDLSLPTDILAKGEYEIHSDGFALSGVDRVIHLLSHLYVQRSFSVWKKPELSEWLAATVISVSRQKLSSPNPPPLRARALKWFAILRNRLFVWRHVLVQESAYNKLLGFVARSALDRPWFACDPLPPDTAMTQYNNDYFHGVEDTFTTRIHERQQAEEQDRIMEEDAEELEMLLEDLNQDPEMLQNFLEDHPQFAGIDLAALQHDPEFREEVMHHFGGQWEDVPQPDPERDERILEQLMPNPEMRAHMEAHLNAHPQFGAMGLAEFVHMARHNPQVINEMEFHFHNGLNAPIEDLEEPFPAPSESPTTQQPGEDPEVDTHEVPEGGDEEVDNQSPENNGNPVAQDVSYFRILPLQAMREVITRFWAYRTAEDPSGDEE